VRDEYDDTIAGRQLSPESLMMSYGYRPEWSEGAIKSPIFQTSTFVFESAADGKRFFELAEGGDTSGEQPGLIYSRLNNPDLEILEHRLSLWDGAEQALVFASGMAAISTALLSYLRPGDVLLHTAPLYGGTDTSSTGSSRSSACAPSSGNPTCPRGTSTRRSGRPSTDTASVRS
jgi:methionine-gamma-lyase